jgi:hypothetical protein
MLRALIALTLCLSLAACGESRLNPMNWFGTSARSASP